jgi:hypothetical protein
MLKARREKGEGAYLDTCWRNGVVRGEPGWFFASEGGVHVGTLWPEAAQALVDQRAMAQVLAANGPALGLRDGKGFQATLAPLLILKPQEEANVAG